MIKPEEVLYLSTGNLYEEEPLHMFNSCNRRLPMKIEKILLPFDGSVHSINATDYALNMAKLLDAHVTILYCYEWRTNMSEVPDMFFQSFPKLLMRPMCANFHNFDIGTTTV